MSYWVSHLKGEPRKIRGVFVLVELPTQVRQDETWVLMLSAQDPSQALHSLQNNLPKGFIICNWSFIINKCSSRNHKINVMQMSETRETKNERTKQQKKQELYRKSLFKDIQVMSEPTKEWQQWPPLGVRNHAWRGILRGKRFIYGFDFLWTLVAWLSG